MPQRLLGLIAVFVGGLVGTAARLGLDTLLPHVTGGSPAISWSTVIVNLVGACALGFLVARLWRLPTTPAWLKLGLGTGLLGSFTTFSAVAVNVVDAASLGNIGVALGALAVSLVAGIAAAWAGLFFGDWHSTWSQTQRTRRLLDAIPDEGIDQ